MTEKVIIDGVDVSGCPKFDENEPDVYVCKEDGIISDCAGNNCLYKQLSRKTEECEKYKQAVDEKNDFLQKLGISASGEFKRIDYYISQQNQKVEKYKQALEEIKELAAGSLYAGLNYDILDIYEALND